ncbi:MAG: membrane-bound PQQ-dependent dehydrogenase, glucose/quinate/shikimate family [Sphingobium sp.]|nr:MAG: membrane-bound PQQ-dependent dehydrogenase, glucose/quinate/shikimate family [Sphingobium sp.]
MPSAQPGRFPVALIRVYAILLVLVGLLLASGGGWLLALGGSPYYLLCGLAVLASGILLWMRRRAGGRLYGLMLLATIAWAIWEVGFNGWALMPRILAPLVLGLVLLLPWIGRAYRDTPRHGPLATAATAMAAGLLAVGAGGALHAFVPPPAPADPMFANGTMTAPSPVSIASSPTSDGDWRNFGNDSGGTRFSPLAQIDADNAAGLKPAWTYKIGDEGTHLEATPLKIGESLYLCSATNDVIALDAETGLQQWRFSAHVDGTKMPQRVCRGVAYYRVEGASGPCAERIIANTIDARLIALDAATGTPCPGFGKGGTVSLLTGMGDVTPGYYYTTSAPTIVSGRVVLGGWVADNQYWGEPSGVVRAYDAVTGAFAWAWDMGRPDRQSEPPPGESYTRSTPNAWAPMSADPALGLVYVPTGNAPPDYFGGYRRPFDDRYSSAVVAIDAATGKPRWSFQTVHHDLWDYDVGSQPTLVDLPMPGGVRHALVQPTKRGEIFVLDRATGRPIAPVVERRTPQAGKAADDRLSPTQPFSTGMPSFRGANLVEADMWGISPIDQLYCRIRFRQMRYDGPMTPPGLTMSLEYPGNMGGIDWGSVSVDTTRHIAVVNSNNMPVFVQLVPRAHADRLGLRPFTARNAGTVAISDNAPQARTPYGVVTGMFMSPLGVPCSAPPYGRLSAIDLVSGKLVWSRPLGTAEEIGPMRIRSHLPVTLGTFTSGGSMASAGGVSFIAAGQDRYLRAVETATGRELWKAKLPGGGSANPMTYLSRKSGRQFVVQVSGGDDHLHTTRGDYVVAYALPKG